MTYQTSFLNSKWTFGILTALLFVATLDHGYRAYIDHSPGQAAMTIVYAFGALLAANHLKASTNESTG